MSNFATIADRLAKRLATVPTLVDRVSNYPNPDPQPPWGVIVPGATQFDQQNGNSLDEQEWVARVLFGRGDDRSAAARLYALLDRSGAASVKTAFDADKTLAGLVSDVWCRGFSEPGIFAYNAGQLLGVEFQITVTI